MDIQVQEKNLIECNISYSREGYVPVVYVVGGNTQIETTLFQDTADFTDSLKMTGAWDGTASTDEKNTDPKKTDVYSRFKTESDSDIYDELDNADEEGNPVGRGVAGPKVYRNFANRTFQYDTSNEAVSSYAYIENNTDEWVKIGSVGQGARIEQGAIPYLRLQAADGAIEVVNKDKNKAVTCIVEGQSHLWALVFENQSNLTRWFYPFSVNSADRFKRQKIYKSYRDKDSYIDNTNPAPETQIEFRNDIDQLGKYAEQILRTSTIPSISGSIEMLGRTQLTLGDKIDNIENGVKSVAIDLAVVDQTTNYSSGTGGQDTVTIELGRK